MRMRRSLTLALVAVATSLGAGALLAQDMVLSQFYASPLLLNPAFAGTSVAPTFALNHRSHYVGFDGGTPYQSYVASYAQYLAPVQSGIGLSILADDAGDGIIATYAASAYYSYNVRINRENSIRIGLSAGMQQRRLDWDRLRFPDQVNSETGLVGPGGVANPTNEQRPEETSITFADFGAGVLYAGKVAYFGVSLDHLTTPDDRLASVQQGGFYKGLPMRWSVHTGAEFVLGNARSRQRTSITPNVMYTHQGPADQLNAGAYLKVGSLFGGAWYRHAFNNADAAIGVVGVEWNMYKFGYSYDYTLSSLGDVSGGTHEVSLVVNFDKAPWIEARRKANRYNDCLNLFR